MGGSVARRTPRRMAGRLTALRVRSVATVIRHDIE
jgi:hypothetical protein